MLTFLPGTFSMSIRFSLYIEHKSVLFSFSNATLKNVELQILQALIDEDYYQHNEGG
jgi:hypothetical protein